MTSFGSLTTSKGIRPTLRKSARLSTITRGFTETAPFGSAEPVSALSQIMRVFVLLLAVVGATGCAKKIAVPSLKDQDLEQAKAMLISQKLKAGNIVGAPGAVPPGTYVLTQNPPPGQMVPANTPIDLTVEVPISVPDFTNSSLPDAVNTLQSLGLKVMLVKQSSPSLKFLSKPKVVQQYPPANSGVRKDTTVTLTVTAPPDMGVLLGLVTKEPSYQNLNPEYRSLLDQFLK